jgi:hypothetical protein
MRAMLRQWLSPKFALRKQSNGFFACGAYPAV